MIIDKLSQEALESVYRQTVNSLQAVRSYSANSGSSPKSGSSGGGSSGPKPTSNSQAPPKPNAPPPQPKQTPGNNTATKTQTADSKTGPDQKLQAIAPIGAANREPHPNIPNKWFYKESTTGPIKYADTPPDTKKGGAKDGELDPSLATPNADVIGDPADKQRGDPNEPLGGQKGGKPELDPNEEPGELDFSNASPEVLARMAEFAKLSEGGDATLDDPEPDLDLTPVDDESDPNAIAEKLKAKGLKNLDKDEWNALENHMGFKNFHKWANEQVDKDIKEDKEDFAVDMDAGSQQMRSFIGEHMESLKNSMADIQNLQEELLQNPNLSPDQKTKIAGQMTSLTRELQRGANKYRAQAQKAVNDLQMKELSAQQRLIEMDLRDQMAGNRDDRRADRREMYAENREDAQKDRDRRRTKDRDASEDRRSRNRRTESREKEAAQKTRDEARHKSSAALEGQRSENRILEKDLDSERRENKAKSDDKRRSAYAKDREKARSEERDKKHKNDLDKIKATYQEKRALAELTAQKQQELVKLKGQNIMSQIKATQGSIRAIMGILAGGLGMVGLGRRRR
jgi:hypothetical protein